MVSKDDNKNDSLIRFITRHRPRLLLGSSSTLVSMLRRFITHSEIPPKTNTVTSTIAMVITTKLFRLPYSSGNLLEQAYATAPRKPAKQIMWAALARIVKLGSWCCCSRGWEFREVFPGSVSEHAIQHLSFCNCLVGDKSD